LRLHLHECQRLLPTLHLLSSPGCFQWNLS
jgi:hypothetical protein